MSRQWTVKMLKVLIFLDEKYVKALKWLNLVETCGGVSQGANIYIVFNLGSVQAQHVVKVALSKNIFNVYLLSIFFSFFFFFLKIGTPIKCIIPC